MAWSLTRCTFDERTVILSLNCEPFLAGLSSSLIFGPVIWPGARHCHPVFLVLSQEHCFPTIEIKGQHPVLALESERHGADQIESHSGGD